MQKEIQLTDKTLLVVGFNTSNPIFIQSGLTSEDPISFKLEYNSASTETKVLPKGDWQLLGIYPELTEEQAKLIVPLKTSQRYSNYPFVDYYPDYNDELSSFHTALESFQSLMEREKCYTVNPYGDVPSCGCMGPSDLGACVACDEFVEAQQRTFSKYAILIKSK